MHFEGICGLKTELNYPFNVPIKMKKPNLNSLYVVKLIKTYNLK